MGVFKETYKSLMMCREFMEDDDLESLDQEEALYLRKVLKACRAITDDFKEYLPEEERLEDDDED